MTTHLPGVLNTVDQHSHQGLLTTKISNQFKLLSAPEPKIQYTFMSTCQSFGLILVFTNYI